MNHVGTPRRVALLLLSVVLAAAALPPPPPAPDKVYVQVVWGTDQVRPAGTSYREIGPKLSAKFSPVFQWKHYWETERQAVKLEASKVTKVSLANQRALELERLKTGEIEVRLFRKSGLVSKTRYTSSSCMAILGGEKTSDSPKASKDSFFVVVRSDEPVTVD
jgi:hypothetical protein